MIADPRRDAVAVIEVKEKLALGGRVLDSLRHGITTALQR